MRLTDRIGKYEHIGRKSAFKRRFNELSESGMVNYMSPIDLCRLLVMSKTRPARRKCAHQGSGNSAYTLDGSGIGIAFIDSGIYTAHNAFKNSAGASRIVASQSFVPNLSATSETYGHGTHVAKFGGRQRGTKFRRVSRNCDKR